MSINNKRVYAAVSLLLTLSACMSTPPKVESEKDASRLSSDVRSLSLRGLADDDIHVLSRFDNLRYITFGTGWANKEAKLTDRGLSVLAEMDWSALRAFRLDRNENITDDGLEVLSNMDMPVLESFVFGPNPNITDEGVEHLVKLKSLIRLTLRGCPEITKEGLKRLSSTSNLTTINLMECNGITDAGIVYLTDMPNIKTIYLGGCENISPELEAKYPGVVNIGDTWMRWG